MVIRQQEIMQIFLLIKTDNLNDYPFSVILKSFASISIELEVFLLCLGDAPCL